jgi:hypothetical protein
MMAEDKKPQEELEFMSVEAETRPAGATADKPMRPQASASPKPSDKETLYVAQGPAKSGGFLTDWRFVWP